MIDQNINDANQNKPNPSATKAYGKSIYLFTNDLRIDDNLALQQACEASERLLCIYIVAPQAFTENTYGLKPIGEHRWQFLYQSLMDLSRSLEQLGQHLVIYYDHPLEVIAKLTTQHAIDAIFRSQQIGVHENQFWKSLKQRHSSLTFIEAPTYTIFSQSNLPIDLGDFPVSFSKFRKKVESTNYIDNLRKTPKIKAMPRTFASTLNELTEYPSISAINASKNYYPIAGGETEGLKHLKNYFSASQPTTYKEVRNELDGWENSTKFSLWLAQGCLSVNIILTELQNFEAHVKANESTYWIAFELLWREYFQWLAMSAKTRLFQSSGIKQTRVTSHFSPTVFQSWCGGNTAEPLVNALMHQLNATGFMSNRGRQLVASYFVNELNLDWRYGAAYFEQQLIDYDVASNWGNWQYLAGVGTDPRGKRHFNIQKQQALYDPAQRFIRRWLNQNSLTIAI